jgi:hypothetical protein
MKNLLQTRSIRSLLLFTLFIFTSNGLSQNLLVTNAGSPPVNGYYLLDGTMNGANKYTQDVPPTSTKHQIFFDGSTYWNLTTVSTPGNVLYRAFTGSGGEDAAPPETGWASTGKTPNPPPTVGSTPLPVELVSFSASVADGTVQLFWRTETEVNNYGFEIQKAVNPQSNIKQWQTTGFIEGAGNTNSPKDYSFYDPDIEGANLIYYRLKQIDNDGSYSYSSEVEVDFLSPNDYLLGQNYPNPFNPSTKISYKIATNEFVNFSVYNILGKEIAVLVNEMQFAGSYSIVFFSDNLPGGVYFYKLETKNFTKTSKMILLK